MIVIASSVPIALNDSLQQDMRKRGLTFIGIDRIGQRTARVSYVDLLGIYRIIEAHAPDHVSDQTVIDDLLFDEIITLTTDSES